MTLHKYKILCLIGADINSNTTCKDGALHLASFCCAKQNLKKGLGIITSLYQAGILLRNHHNKPPPSFKNPHFQNEAKGTTFLAKISFIYMGMRNNFHIKGLAVNLVLIKRPWGIGLFKFKLISIKLTLTLSVELSQEVKIC